MADMVSTGREVRFSLSLAALLAASLGSVCAADDQDKSGDAFFADELYPVLQRLECNLCHNDNGVASATEVAFPPAGAAREQVIAFGLKLLDVVDRQQPAESLLLLKPTNREEHTGGERIPVGSHEEQLLIRWVEYLAGLTDEEVSRSRERIAVAEQHQLRALTVRRLTHHQYNSTVRDLLGDQTQPANQFPPEDFVRGFKNQLESQGVSPLLADAYSKAAERLALSAFRGGDRRGLIPGDFSSAGDQLLAREFIRQFGLRAFRRPVTESEIEQYLRLFQRQAEGEDSFLAGARMVVETILQSPHFLFRIERGGMGPLAQYERASRLAYFLWNTMPDDQLLSAARRGELATDSQVETAARRMLADPRARAAMDEFLSQWMRFDRVLTATRDRRRFGQFNTELAAAMTEETRRLFHHLVWEDRSFMEFFTADYTFISSDLARLYQLPPPDEEYGLVRYPAASGRGGVLGHASFLLLTSKPAETSPTERGLFVRNHFLGQEVPPPPAGVNTDLPTVTEDRPLTNRQRLSVHLNSESCASCHRLIDPIGFGFEHYDAIGAYQEKMSLRIASNRYDEGGRRKPITIELAVDTAAYVQGIDDSAFSTPRELGQILARSQTCQRCIVKQLFRYAFGREETAEDQPTIDRLVTRFRESGFRFRELIVALVTSDLFLQRG